MRVFLDANILFTAAYSSSGRAAALFALAAEGHAHLLSSAFALEEARRNLESKAPEQIPRLTSLLDFFELVPEGTAKHLAVAGKQLPEKDAPILAAALRARADTLVTGDIKHFGALFGRTMGGVEVLSLAGVLERLL